MAALALRPSCYFLSVLEQKSQFRRGVSCCASSTNLSVIDTSANRATLIWRAVKLPIYSVALVPLSVGSAVSFLETGAFDSGQYWLLLLSSASVITWLNLSNDAYDAETGVDKDKAESVVNMIGSQKGVLRVSYACLVLGSLGLLKAALRATDLRVVFLLAAAVSCGFVYQCPPFRLSYKGLGEPLCFLAFGPLATTAFYLCQSQRSPLGRLSITPAILAASAIVGLTTSLILFCSHFHQIEGDKAVGKLSPLVRLGTTTAASIVHLVVKTLYMGTGALAALKILPQQCALLSMLTLPLGKLVVEFIGANHQNKQKIFAAKYYCVRLHVAFGAVLVLGFLLKASGS